MRVFLSLVACVALVSGAEAVYSGKWSSSSSGNGGDIQIRLKPEPEVVFTLSGREVKTKIVRASVADVKFELDYDFALEGYELRSSLKATMKGDKAEGSYQTKSIADGSLVDAGTFEVTAK